MTKLAIVDLSCALFACGPRAAGDSDAGGNGDAVGQHVLTAIEVTPTNPIVELDLNQTGMQGFAAMGRFQDGNDMDISDRVNWSVVNPAVGTLSGTTLNIPGFATTTVEVSRIKAELDGVIGEAQITVVAYRRSGPQQDFFFVLPYMPSTGEVAKPLDFGTAIPALDVFFLMDTTGSMFGEITNLKNALTGTIVPQVQSQIPNTQFGVGAYEDFPVDPYGSLHGSDCGRGGLATPDQPLHLFQTITNNITAVQAGVNSLSTATGPIGCGNDTPESLIEGMYQVATGSGLSTPSPTNVPAHTGGVGGVSFRAGSMPVVIPIGDAVSHAVGEAGNCSGVQYGGAVAAVAHSRAQTKTALNNICGRVVGVASIEPTFAAGCTAQPDMEDFATATGARVPPSVWDVPARPAGCAANQCCTNQNGAGRAPDADGLCPLVFRTDNAGTGLGAHIVTGLKMLTRFALFNVTSERQGVTTDIDGVPLPAPHTTADFIKSVTPTGFMLPPAPPVVPNPTFDATTFYGVTPTTRVQFDVKALNDFLPQTADAQIFRATIRVVAGGCTDLDQRDVLILVPPNPIVIQ